MLIYLVTNTVNGKRYVGKTKDLNLRWQRHCKTESCPALRNAIDKYGKNSFIQEIIGTVPDSFGAEFEIEYINKYNTKFPNGYNLTDGGEGPLGRRHKESTRQLLSIALKGNICALGSVRTPEIRAKLSVATKSQMAALKASPEKYKEFLIKSSRPHLGAKRSEETKARMRAAWTLRKSRGVKVTFSEETKARMKAAQKARRLRERNV